jgi:hypothetical protein
MAVDPVVRLQSARKAACSLFDVMNLKRVVVVDDVLSTPFMPADVIGQCVAYLNGGKTVALKAVPELAGIDFEIPDREVLTANLRAAIEPMDETARRSIAVQLADAKDDKDDAENASRTQLEGILQDFDVRCLSLAQWNAEKGNLLSDPSVAETLFLFDQDMSQAEGTDVEGMRIIAGILTDKRENAIYCALISHTVTAGNEHEAIDRLAKDHGIESVKDRLVVISKAHLRDDPMAFAFRIKRAAIAPRCGELKNMVLTVVQEAVEHARKELESLNVYDFEQIVFQSSYLEGVWEPDTLIRLFNLFHRREARAKSIKHDGIRRTADAVRQVIEIPYKPDDAPKSSSSAIMRLEMFEDADYLNTHHLPLELGDIFQGKKGRLFVLVVPPCDLMVRRDGARPGCEDASLAGVFDANTAGEKLWFKLPCFDATTFVANWVRLSKPAVLPLRVLDLTVFDSEGKSKMRFDEPAPNGLIPSWTKRYDRLATEVRDIHTKYAGLVAGLEGNKKNEALRHVRISMTGGGSQFPGDIDMNNKEISYNLKRVGRLKEPFASALLRAYSAFVSRDAYEHPFTRAIHEIEE